MGYGDLKLSALWGMSSAILPLVAWAGGEDFLPPTPTPPEFTSLMD